MKKSVFAIIFVFIFGCTTSNAQTTAKDTEQKTGLKLSGVNLMLIPPYISNGDFSLQRMRALAPESELLHRDLSGFEPGYSFTEAGYTKVPPISILLNVDIHSKNNLIQKLRPEIRVGLGYRNSQLIGGGLSREDTYSTQSDDGTPLDSIRKQDFGHYIEVTWGDSGQGVVHLELTSAAGCTGTKELCVKIVDKPEADFSINIDDAICTFTNIRFTDQSIDAFRWEWNFGDGTTSTLQNPTHAYTVEGNYDVSLIVENKCGCRDTAYLNLEVEFAPKIELYCITPVCQRMESTYSILSPDADPCDDYNITVPSSGYFNYDPNFHTFNVEWGSNVGPEELIMIEDPCTGCTRYFYVPVFNHDSGQISGEHTVCANSIEEYEMSLWPGTQYQWSINPSNAGEIAYGQGDHKVFVAWDSTTTSAQLSVHYEHPILGACSEGHNSLNIEIKPDFEFTGPEIICENSGSVSFEVTAAGGVTGDFNYIVTEEQTGNPVDSGAFSGSLFNPNLPHAGVFLIQVTQNNNTYCNNAYYRTITVLDVPSTPDSNAVFGEVEVCEGKPYAYSYTGELPQGYYLRWDFTGADLDSSFSNPASVTWNLGTPPTATVSFVQKDEPYCESGGRDVNISPLTLSSVAITGPDSTCNNSEIHYQSQGEGHHFAWSVSPTTAGSVVSGNGTANAVIQWNNYTGFATINLMRQACDTLIADQKTVELTGMPTISILSKDTLCQFESDTLAVSPAAGISSYVWDFGLPAGDSVAQPVVTYPDSGTYFIDVEAYYPGCARPSTNQKIIYVREAPVAYISTPDPLLECENPTLYGTVQGTIPGTPTYEWFENTNPPTSLGGGSTLVSPPSGEYFLVATLSSMVCPAVSNPITVSLCPTGTPPSGGGTPTPCTPADTIAASVTDLGCGNIEINASINHGRITAIKVNELTPVFYTSSPAFHTHERAGFYSVVIEAIVENANPTGADSCIIKTSIQYEIELTADFYYFITCGPGNDYSYEFKNRSTHTPGNSIIATDWSTGAGTFSAGFHANEDFPQSSTQTVTLEVDNGTQSCTTQQVIEVPDKPTAFFEPAQPACVNQAVLFTDLSTGDIKTWHWDYDEIDAYINGNSYYTYNSPAQFPLPHNVSLFLTDRYQCTDQFDTTVEVSSSMFDLIIDTLEPSKVLWNCKTDCSSLSFSNNTNIQNLNYLWSTLETTQAIDVCEPGRYFLTVTDPATSCIERYGPVHLGHYPPAAPAILGDTLLCQNEVYRFLGNSGNGITHTWYDSSFSNPLNIPNLNYFSGNTAGANHIYLELIDVISGCRDTSRFNFYVQPNLGPQITANTGAPFCENSGVELDFTLNNPPAASFHWNSGLSTTPVTAHSPGPYLLTAYDEIGCSYFDTAEVDPFPYIRNFMCGCYEVCAEDSFLLPGVPGSHQNYTWLINGFPVTSDTGTIDPQQLLFGTHHYQLVVESENGCADTTCTAEISVVYCDVDNEGPCDIYPCSDSCDLGIEPLGVDSCKSDAAGNHTYFATAALYSANFSGVIWYAEDQLGNPVNIIGNPGITQGQANVTAFEMQPGGANPFCVTFYIKPDNVDSLCMIEFCFEIPSIPCPRGKRALTVENREAQGALNLYPNPATDRIHIAYSSARAGSSFVVYSVTGEEIYTSGSLPSEGVELISTSRWSPGVYVLHFQHPEGYTQVRKVVIGQE